METINVYDYLENDHTLINDLIDLNLDSSTALDSIFETSLYDEQNEQITNAAIPRPTESCYISPHSNANWKDCVG